MALKLYRRHHKDCEAELPEDARTGQFEESRRGWKRCACLIHAAGTLGGRFNRRQTGNTDWDEVKDVAAQWEAAGSWDGKPKPEPPAPPAAARRITIDDAIKVFLTLREGGKIAPATLRKYKTFTKQLLAFAESRGHVVLDQFTSADIDTFYGGMKLGARAKASVPVSRFTLKEKSTFCTATWTT
jgi:hypothetical protein